MTITVFAYGYHTKMVWDYSRAVVERDRAITIRDWQFSHSPGVAMTSVMEVPLEAVEADWHPVVV